MKRLCGFLLFVLLWLLGALPAMAVELDTLEVNGHRVPLQKGVTAYTLQVSRREMVEGGINITASCEGRVGGTGNFLPLEEEATLQVVGFNHHGNPDTYYLTLVPYEPLVVEAGSTLKKLDAPVVALTIDDGYNGNAIASVLETTKKCGVKATFFVTGACLKKHAALWQQAIAEGHDICWHSMNHAKAADMNAGSLAADIDAWRKRAHEILGEDYELPPFVRLPYGAGRTVDWISRVFTQKEVVSAVWSVDPFSGTGASNSSAAYRDYLLNNTKEGSILLLHFNPCDARALEEALPVLCETYTFVCLSDLYMVNSSAGD